MRRSAWTVFEGQEIREKIIEAIGEETDQEYESCGFLPVFGKRKVTNLAFSGAEICLHRTRRRVPSFLHFPSYYPLFARFTLAHSLQA